MTASRKPEHRVIRRKREEGYCCVTCENYEYHLLHTEYARVLAEWKRGVAFIDTIGFYGSTMSIKAGRIEAISDIAPPAIAEARDDNAANDTEDSIGGSNG